MTKSSGNRLRQSNSYTITSGSPATSTLTIRGGVAADGNDISVANGAHTISAPVIVAGSTNAIVGGTGSSISPAASPSRPA